MRLSPLFLALGLPLASACEAELGAPRRTDTALERRIEQKRASLAARPDDPDLSIELGDLHREAGRYFEAADAYRAALEAGAKGAGAQAGLASTYLKLGYTKPAVDAMKACFEVDRKNGECLYAFGLLLESDGSPKALEEARRTWAHLLAVAPDHPRAPYARSALEQLNARLGPNPADPHTPSTDPPAPSGTEAPSVIVPGHAGMDPHGGESVGELNPFGRAIMRAIDAVRRNDAAEAERAFAEALAIRPDDPAALAGYAEAAFAQQKSAEAVRAIEKAYAIDPKDPQVQWTFGLIMLREKKRTEEALNAWRELAKNQPEYAKQLNIEARIANAEKLMR